MEIQIYKDSNWRKAKNSCNMRHHKHNSRVAQQGCKICILQFNTSQEHINEDLTLSLAWLQCLKPKWNHLPITYAVSWHPPCGVVFIKELSRSSVNLAELGEENTVHIQRLSFRNENDFLLKLVVSSRQEISMNFPRNSLFLWFPKNNCLAVRKMYIQSSWLIGPNSEHFPNWNLKMHTFYI